MSAMLERESEPFVAAHELARRARQVYAKDPVALATIERTLTRLDEPLRVALAGSVKAGKSTLLNALLGENLAPTDARECTRIVTSYRHGISPSVTARERGTGGPLPIRLVRQPDRFELDLGELSADEVEQIDVVWPSESLRDLTIIDTPGTASISTAVSSRTQEFVAPRDGVSGVDAVVYMLRSLHASDVAFLSSVRREMSHGAAALGSVAVLSRADELGGGRLDAMVSINRAVARLRRDPALTDLVETVVPVAGILGLGGHTMRQAEFRAFVALEALPRERLQELLVSADRFIADESADLPSASVRAGLVERYGVFGVRLAVATLRGGARSAPALSAELVRRSGLDQLRRVIDVHFVQRAPELKARSAVLAILRLTRATPAAGSDLVAEMADDYLSRGHAFMEMRVAGRLNLSSLGLSENDRDAFRRVIGGHGTSTRTRLGLEESADTSEVRAAATQQLWTWSELAENPLTPPETAQAALTAVRSCEVMLHRLHQPVAPAPTTTARSSSTPRSISPRRSSSR